jgi:hypothetical protein
MILCVSVCVQGFSRWFDLWNRRGIAQRLPYSLLLFIESQPSAPGF